MYFIIYLFYFKLFKQSVSFATQILKAEKKQNCVAGVFVKLCSYRSLSLSLSYLSIYLSVCLSVCRVYVCIFFYWSPFSFIKIRWKLRPYMKQVLCF